MHTRIHTCIHIHVHINAYTPAHTYTHTHLHIHTRDHTRTRSPRTRKLTYTHVLTRHPHLAVFGKDICDNVVVFELAILEGLAVNVQLRVLEIQMHLRHGSLRDAVRMRACVRACVCGCVCACVHAKWACHMAKSAHGRHGGSPRIHSARACMHPPVPQHCRVPRVVASMSMVCIGSRMMVHA